MNAGDKVQVRQFDGVDHWIYAKVLDPATGLVQVQHPGNVDHEKQIFVPAADIRTKADLEKLLAVAKSMSKEKLTDVHINNLGAADGWVLRFKHVDQAQARNTLHTLLVPHYQAQVNKLS